MWDYANLTHDKSQMHSLIIDRHKTKYGKCKWLQ